MASLVQPIINRLQDVCEKQAVLHKDETPLLVRNEPVKTAQNQNHMRVIATTQANVPAVLYHYSASRSGDTPKALLETLLAR